MLDSLTSEMLKPLLRGAKQRVVCLALIFSIFFLAVEASTQVASLYFANRRSEAVALALEAKELPPAVRERLSSTQAQNAADIVSIHASIRAPAAFLAGACIRFMKGAWPAFPFGALVLWLMLKFFARNPGKGVANVFAFSFGFGALRVVATFAAANGLISAYWNVSDGFWASWIAFPLGSAIALIGLLFLLFLVEEKETPPRSANVGPPTDEPPK